MPEDGPRHRTRTNTSRHGPALPGISPIAMFRISTAGSSRDRFCRTTPPARRGRQDTGDATEAPEAATAAGMRISTNSLCATLNPFDFRLVVSKGVGCNIIPGSNECGFSTTARALFLSRALSNTPTLPSAARHLDRRTGLLGRRRILVIAVPYAGPSGLRPGVSIPKEKTKRRDRGRLRSGFLRLASHGTGSCAMHCLFWYDAEHFSDFTLRIALQGDLVNFE